MKKERVNKWLVISTGMLLLSTLRRYSNEQSYDASPKFYDVGIKHFLSYELNEMKEAHGALSGAIYEIEKFVRKEDSNWKITSPQWEIGAQYFGYDIL